MFLESRMSSTGHNVDAPHYARSPYVYDNVLHCGEEVPGSPASTPPSALSLSRQTQSCGARNPDDTPLANTPVDRLNNDDVRSTHQPRRLDAGIYAPSTCMCQVPMPRHRTSQCRHLD